MNVPGAFGKRVNCACCDNPWNVDALVGDVVCSPCLVDNKGFSGIDPGNFDSNISPRENFYLWSNGNWMKKNPIPGRFTTSNNFDDNH